MSGQFGEFTASEIYCPKCKRSQPVRERLLLVLPAGELHEYLCAHCGASVGTREVKAGEGARLIAASASGDPLSKH
jgi:hypothetical protein